MAVETLLLALAAAAAPLPEGIVEDPCIGAPQRSAVIEAYRKDIYRVPPGGKLPTPPPEAAAYRDAAMAHARRDWGNLCYYRAENARLAAAPGPRRVVFMGDSITEGWGIADPAQFSDDRVNRGISGQTTPQMLLRFSADVVALRPRIVHILAGTNDIAGNSGPSTMQDVKNNIVAMATLARANGIRVVLGSVPPARGFSWKPGIEPAPQIAALNAWLAGYARANGHGYADYHRVLAAPDDAMRPEYTFDGVHPNVAGYRAIEPVLTCILQKVEQRARAPRC